MATRTIVLAGGGTAGLTSQVDALTTTVGTLQTSVTTLENADGSRTFLQTITTAKDAALLDDDDLARLPIPDPVDGWTVDSIHFKLTSPSSSGAVTFRVGRWRPSTGQLVWFYGATTRITIDQGDYSSKDSAVTPSVNDTYTTVAADDYLWVECSDYGTGAVGLSMEVRFVE